MTKINPQNFYHKAGHHDQMPPKFIPQNENIPPYVFHDELQVIEYGYQDIPLMSITYATGQTFFDKNKLLPYPDYALYTKCYPEDDVENTIMPEILFDVNKYATSDEKNDLLAFLNEKLENAGVAERFTMADVFDFYEYAKDNKPDNPICDPNKYSFRVRLLKAGAEPQTLEGVDFSTLKPLLQDTNHVVLVDVESN